MASVGLLDHARRRRSPATLSGFRQGRAPRNEGLRYPPDPPTVEEIIAVMRRSRWFLRRRNTRAVPGGARPEAIVGLRRLPLGIRAWGGSCCRETLRVGPLMVTGRLRPI